MADTRRTDLALPLATVIMDALAIEGSFACSYLLRTKTLLFERFGFLDTSAPPFSSYFLSSLIVIVVWLLLFHARRMYRSRRNVTMPDELIAIVKVVTLGMLIVMSAAFFYRGFSYSRIIFVLLWCTSIVFLFFGRAVVHSYERRLYRKGKHLRPALIIGADVTADTVYRKLHGHRSFGFTIIGYCADTKAGEMTALRNAQYLGVPEDTPSFIHAHDVEVVFIALPSSENGRLAMIFQQCEGINVEFLMIPDMVGLLTNEVRAQELEGIPFLKLKEVPLTIWGRILKRLFDVVVSAMLSIALLPFWLVIAAVIKLTSSGPVFFRQERIGLDSKPFLMYKFRSMGADAEHQTGPVWAQAYDPRRTSFGVFLRKTSIDELPQLLNVLKGEMSLVGPRPERPYFVEQFKTLVPKYLDRHRVKTGMTGWAQVNGLRGDTSLEERIKYDIYYIEHWSFAFDIRILFRTIHTTLRFREVH